MCDEPDGLVYVHERHEEYYCSSCYYEEFHREAFTQGLDEADAEIKSGEIYDVDLAIGLFSVDPPDSAYQHGFLQALKEHNNEGKCCVCGESEDVMQDERNNYYCHAHIPIEWKEGEISH